MYYVMLALVLSISFSNCNSPITFTNHKNTQGALDQLFLKQLIDIFGITIFVETGTYSGETTAQADLLFKKIHTIELHEKIAQAAQERFTQKSHITVHQGSSPNIFMKILPELKNEGILLFFLDAHFCGQGTAVDKEGPQAADGITAVRKELDAIKQCNIPNCVILIDDIRGFGTKIENKEFIGCWAYPCVQDLCKQLLTINNNFAFALIGDMLLVFDKIQYDIPLSPVVQACTISRLFNGSNYTEEELLHAESTIGQAEGEEKKYIEHLYQDMTNHKDPEFHYDLWYGLLCLQQKKYTDAAREFNKVLERNYMHWRIEQYKELALQRNIA